MDTEKINNAEIEKRVALLKNISIFSQTTLQNVYKIAECLKLEQFEAEQEIFHKGDPGDSMYIIINGSVNIHDGSHVFITLKTNQFFGEFSILDENVRSASATTVEKTELLSLHKINFYEMFDGNKEFARGVLRSIVKRFNDKDFLEAQLVAKNEEITLQKAEIEEKNEHIMSSIRYALRIQKAILPMKSTFDELFDDYFVLYKPKDIVSGDFYWLHVVEDKIFIATVDCTGHGVPGAFMSMIGNTLLNQIILEKEIYDPALILENLNILVRNALKQEGEMAESRDGMDLGLVMIDTLERKITFAGAKRPMFIYVNGEFTEVKSDLKSIGGFQREERKVFTNQHYNIELPCKFYFSTDGYSDQMNKEGKKMGSKRFKEFLTEIGHHPLKEQKQMLIDEFDKFRDGADQIDDVTIIALQVK